MYSLKHKPFSVGPTIHQKEVRKTTGVVEIEHNKNELNMWCDRNSYTHINMTNYLHQLLSWFCLRWHFVSACNIVSDILPLKAHHHSSFWPEYVSVCEILRHLIAFVERCIVQRRIGCGRNMQLYGLRLSSDSLMVYQNEPGTISVRIIKKAPLGRDWDICYNIQMLKFLYKYSWKLYIISVFRFSKVHTN